MRALALACLVLAQFGSSTASGGETSRYASASDGHYNFGKEQTDELLSSLPGTEVILPAPSGGGHIVARYDGHSRLSDGSPYFHFWFLREANSGEARQAEGGKLALSPGWQARDGSAGGSEAPAPATERSSADSSAPAKGNADTGGGWKSVAENSGYAAGKAALTAGLIHGVLLPPGQKRALRALEKEINQQAVALNQTEAGLQREIREFQASMAQKIGGGEGPYQPYRGGAGAPAVSSEFAASSAGEKVRHVRERLAYSVPARPTNQAAKSAALASAAAAEGAFAEGLPLEADTLATIAEGFTDLALGINPVTGFLKDGLELITGRHALTQRELSGFERGLAGVGFAAGLASAGLASTALHGAELIAKILANGNVGLEALRPVQEFAVYATALGVRSAQGWLDLAKQTRAGLGDAIRKLERISSPLLYHPGAWAKRYHLDRVFDAEYVNALEILAKPGHLPAYRPGSKVFEIVTKQEEVFVRLHGPNQVGNWFIRGEAIDRSLTASELRVKYSLKYNPEYVSEVTVPAGSRLRRGKVNTNFNGAENAIQYELRSSPEGVAFGKPKPIAEFLRSAPLDEIP